jgi:hypothetical protein
MTSSQTDGDAVFYEESSSKEIPVKKPTFIDLTINKDYRLISGKKMQSVLFMAEYLAAENSGEVGNTVYFRNKGNGQNGAGFVPDNTFLDFTDGSNDITYYIDHKRPTEDIDVQVSSKAIGRAMNTWDKVTSSKFGITEREYSETINTGVVAGFFGYGPPVHSLYGYVADVVHAGWLPPAFFDLLAPGGSDFILGVTFTFVIAIDEEIVDQDHNGMADVHFREIYYNDKFLWNKYGGIDVETVALHEAGHGLSQEHFGKVFGTHDKSKIYFAPRNVMNATYSGIQTDIK